MEISIVDTLPGFEALRRDWEEAHARDPHTTVFTSWAWLRGWLELGAGRWLVLTARPRPRAAAVAFLPLRTREARGGALDPETTLCMAGWPAADYTGLVAAPEHADEALRALATHVGQQLPWRRLELRDVHDPRVPSWLQGFDPRHFATQRDPGERCPGVTLPSSFDAYLRSRLGPRRREWLRRRMRRIAQLPEYRAQDAGPDDLADATARVVHMWQRRWQNATPEEVEAYVLLLRRSAAGCELWLRTLWCGARAMASMVAFIDRPRGAFRFYLGGYDPAFSRHSPGAVLLGQAIQHAVEAGLHTFDFMRGAEAYKYSFGATDQLTLHASVERLNQANA